MYHLQFLRRDDEWHTVDTGDDLKYLTKRLLSFMEHAGVERSKVRIIVANPPAVRWQDQEASGLGTFLALALVILLIAVIGVAFAG
jgi:hypothetical protein